MELNLTTLSNHLKPKVIWIWEDNEWHIYTTDNSLKEKALQLGYNLIDTVNTKGFWIEK